MMRLYYVDLDGGMTVVAQYPEDEAEKLGLAYAGELDEASDQPGAQAKAVTPVNKMVTPKNKTDAGVSDGDDAATVPDAE